MLTSHTDIAGSLLRPLEPLEAREKVASGLISQGEFKAIEDRAVDDSIALQEDAGLEVVTNGEQRRLPSKASCQKQWKVSVMGIAMPSSKDWDHP